MKTWTMAVLLGVGVMAGGEAMAARHRASAPHLSGVVNLNQAPAASLHLLPGVSTKAAEGIVTYRTAHPFTRVEELVKVKGFGKKRFERLRPYLTLQGDSTLKRLTVLKSSTTSTVRFKLNKG